MNKKSFPLITIGVPVYNGAATLAAAYPADPGDLLHALADPSAGWPGSGIIWMNLRGSDATVLPDRPRGIPAPATRHARQPGFRLD